MRIAVATQTPTPRCEVSTMKFVPADSSIAELKRKAAECEQKAEHEKEPLASQLKEEARMYRGWIAALKSKKWTS